MNEALSSSNELWMQQQQQQLYQQTIHTTAKGVTSTTPLITSSTTAAAAAAAEAATGHHDHYLTPKAKAKAKDKAKAKQPCIRRRSRASKRTPTTLLNADAKNFRSLVQQFTGCCRRSGSTSISFGNPISSAPVNINFALGTHHHSRPKPPNYAAETTPHYLSQLLVQQRDRDIEERQEQYDLLQVQVQVQGQGQAQQLSSDDHDHYHQEILCNKLSFVDSTTTDSITTHHHDHDHHHHHHDNHDQDFGIIASACFPRSCPADHDIPHGLVVDDIMYFLAGSSLAN